MLPEVTESMVQPKTSYLESVACNLCGKDDFSILFNYPMRLDGEAEAGDFVASTDRFDRYGQIVRCRSCSLVYTNPRPVSQQILNGYAEAVDADYATEDSSRSINAHMSLHTLRKFSASGRLLDVGCATGYFLNAARLGFETYGLEPSHWAAAYAQQNLQLNVQQGSLETQAFTNGFFDVVTMIDVIEHFMDPLAALQTVHRLLKTDGLLYLVTPNIHSVSARLLRGKWWGLRPAHLYYFSPETLTAMLDKVGFEVVLRRSYGRIFTYGYWLSRLRNYPWLVRATVGGVVNGLSIKDKFLYLDTRDSMELCARRR